MQIREDDLNLSLLDCGKLLSALPSNGINRSSEEFVLEGSTLNSNVGLNFSSIVDEVFELEKGSSVPSFSALGPPSTFGASPVSHLGAGVVGLRNPNLGMPSPKWERGVETNNASRASNMLSNYNPSVYDPSSYSGLLQSGSPDQLWPHTKVVGESGLLPPVTLAYVQEAGVKAVRVIIQAVWRISGLKCSSDAN